VNARCLGEGQSGAVVEIGALDHTGEHPFSQPESTLVDALADALLQVRCPHTE